MPAQQIALTDKIRLFIDWLPALQLVQLVIAAKPGRDRAAEVVRVVEFLATKTDMPTDDEVVKLVKAVVLTDQCGQLIDYLTEKLRSLTDAAA